MAFAALAILAACSGKSDDKSADEAAQAAALKLQPGQWEMTSEVTKMEMPGHNGEMPGLKQAKVTTSNCITQAQVDQPQPTLFSATKGACKYDEFSMKDGRITSSMTCKQPNTDNGMHMRVDGKYTATSMDATVEMVSAMPGGNMTMSSTLSGKRVGECTGETPEKTG